MSNQNRDPETDGLSDYLKRPLSRHFHPDINGGRRFTCREFLVYANLKHTVRDWCSAFPTREICAFTYSPSDKINPFKRNTEQYYNTAPQVDRMLRASTNFFIVPEYNKRQRIHFHGLVQIKDPIKFGKQTYHMLYNRGMLRIKAIDRYHKWISYCIKDYTDNCKIIDKRFIHGSNMEPYMPRPIVLKPFTRVPKRALFEYKVLATVMTV